MKNTAQIETATACQKSGFTPGPWTQAVPPSSSLSTIRYIEADGFTVADINAGCGEIPQAEALSNARLIASAPDLLAALEKIDANTAESVEWIRRVARAAIAKAKGAQS